MMQPFKYKPKINSGDLRNRVEVYADMPYKNELLETAYRAELVGKVWADIIPQTARLQNQQADTILTNVTHKIITRYSKMIMDVYQDEDRKSSMHIKHRGHRYDVRYILNPYLRDESLEIFVQEVIG